MESPSRRSLFWQTLALLLLHQQQTVSAKNKFQDVSLVKNPVQPPHGILVVSTADGTLAGLNKETGEVVWKRESEAPPLVSTTTTTTTTDDDDWKTTAIPSILDNTVYLSAVDDDVERHVISSIPELAVRTPFVDSRGRTYTSTTTSTTMGIDAHTGEIRITLSDQDPNDRNSLVWLGRKDYKIQIKTSNAQLDVEFGSSELTTISDMMHNPNTFDDAKRIIATPNGNIGYLDADTRELRWISNARFDSPVSFAMDADLGLKIPISLVPDAIQSGGPPQYLESEMNRRVLEIEQPNEKSDDDYIMGRFPTGELFAMPLGKKTESSLTVPSQCLPDSPEFPQCLPDDTGLAETVQFHHPDYGYVPMRKRKPKSNRVLKFLGSWIPAAIAIAFVSSFELGRRRRQLEKAEPSGIIKLNERDVLGHGGHGTMVYSGELIDGGRKVAVKRMLKTYSASADREMKLLIESDGHPNVVRYFLRESRGDFVYLALELCDLSLHDLVTAVSNRPLHFAATRNLLLDISQGVRHIHRLRIVHRDLKPANILLAQNSKRKSDDATVDIFSRGGYTAKISDMGLGKQLVGHSSYGGSHLDSFRAQHSHNNGQSSSFVGAGPGSVGWQAPEVMAARVSPSDGSAVSEANSLDHHSSEASPVGLVTATRTSRSVDIFSLGCIFYAALVPGSHPFGEWYEREANVMHNRPNIERLREISPEAYDLVRSMLSRNPSRRPTAKQICEHPFFWAADRRLAFLCDLSDRLENDAALVEEDKSLLGIILAFESNANAVVGTAWDTVLDEDLVSNVHRFRSYDASSVRHLLRLIRNKNHHFDELPQSLRDSIGSKSEGLAKYFEARFPKLLSHCYEVCHRVFEKGDSFCIKYGIVATPSISLAEAARGACPEIEADDDEEVLEAPPQLVHSDLDPVPEEPNSRDDTPPSDNETVPCTIPTEDLVVWEGSTAAQSLGCRGWSRSDSDFIRRGERMNTRRRDPGLVRAQSDARFRTRLCNHWDMSGGTECAMRSKGKCIFAHGPVELRVKEPKRGRWGKLVDKDGNNKNPNHSGGEDTYGAALAIETERKTEGKWNTTKRQGPKNAGFKNSNRKGNKHRQQTVVGQA